MQGYKFSKIGAIAGNPAGVFPEQYYNIQQRQHEWNTDRAQFLSDKTLQAMGVQEPTPWYKCLWSVLKMGARPGPRTKEQDEFAKTIIKQRVKAWSGWERDPVTGTYKRSTEAWDKQRKALESGDGGISSYFVGAEHRQAVKDGMTEGAKQLVEQDPLKNIPWGVGLWMQQHGAPQWAVNWAKNPWTFYGTIAAGGVGLLGLLGALNRQPQYSQPPVQQPQPAAPAYQMPTTTSYWRA